MSQITTHILDTSKGKPAAGVVIVLYHQHNNWEELTRGITNADGRISNLLASDVLLPLGTYKMKFETKSYFDTTETISFYPFIEIVFEIASKEHYHVPLLLNPYGYSTYRGS